MSFLNKLFGKTTKEEEIMTEKLNIGIILGSTRQGRLSPQVGEWVKGLQINVEMLIMKSLILQISNYHF